MVAAMAETAEEVAVPVATEGMATDPSHRLPMSTSEPIVLDCRRRGRGLQYLVHNGGQPPAWKKRNDMTGYEELLKVWSPRPVLPAIGTHRCGKRTRETPMAQAATETVDEVWPAQERGEAVRSMPSEEARVPAQSTSGERRLSQRNRHAVQLYVAGPAPPSWELAATARLASSFAERKIELPSSMPSSKVSHEALHTSMLNSDRTAIIEGSMGSHDGVVTAPPVSFTGTETRYPVLSGLKLTGSLECGMDAVRQMLTTLHLESYADVFEENGFDDLSFLASLSHERLAQVATLLQSPCAGSSNLIGAPALHPSDSQIPSTGGNLESHRG